ncbi:MAG: cob(I)yrinic acid a,c-diamide adenosyltransferase [Nocardioidaceae bacterium]
MSNLQDSPDTTQPPHYTGSGDQGRTVFGVLGEVGKQDVRVVAHGGCEEANAAIGVVLALGSLTTYVTATLASVQDDLFDLAADLSEPVSRQTESTVRIVDAHIERLERACDHYSSQLTPKDGEVLPGGTVASALMYQARTVVRRAERNTWVAVEQHPDSVNPLTARYLNRLSSMLFVLARGANVEHGDSIWRPGASVTPVPQVAPEEQMDATAST